MNEQQREQQLISPSPFQSLKVETKNELAFIKSTDQSIFRMSQPISPNSTNSRQDILSATRRLQKTRHFTQCKEVMSPTVYRTQNIVSMDQCKEMIDIENEFGSCLVDESPLMTLPSEEPANNYWMLLHQKLNQSNSKQFNSFINTIHCAVLQASTT